MSELQHSPSELSHHLDLVLRIYLSAAGFGLPSVLSNTVPYKPPFDSAVNSQEPKRSEFFSARAIALVFVSALST